MEDHAFVSVIHAKLPSEQFAETDVVVQYLGREVRLRIRPKHPSDGSPAWSTAVAQELRDLGTALLRIVDQPSAIYDHNPHQS